MAKYRKKPVVIDAVLWTGDNFDEVYEFTPDVCWYPDEGDFGEGELYISTLEGELHASVGDYIINGVKGESYVCKPDVFALTYELVHE